MVDDDANRDESLDPRIYFAAERTLLAWVRTGLALMGFGFVVARFGLFLREISALPNATSQHRPGFSLWVGTALVMLGVAINLGSAVKYWRTVRRLERGERLRFSAGSMEIVVACSLALLGLLMAIYLIFGFGS